jgi:hypothetical protein
VCAEGTPTFGAAWLNKVNAERRTTGRLPTRAATRLVVPIDNPNGSLITDHTIAAG